MSEASYHFPRKEVMLPMCHRCPPPCKVSCLSTTTRHMSEATSTQVHTTIWQLKDLKATERFMCQSTVMLNAHRSSTAEHVFVVRQHRSSTAEHFLLVFGLCHVLSLGIYSEQFFYVLIFTDHGPTITTVHETWSDNDHDSECNKCITLQPREIA